MSFCNVDYKQIERVETTEEYKKQLLPFLDKVGLYTDVGNIVAEYAEDYTGGEIKYYIENTQIHKLKDKIFYIDMVLSKRIYYLGDTMIELEPLGHRISTDPIMSFEYKDELYICEKDNNALNRMEIDLTNFTYSLVLIYKLDQYDIRLVRTNASVSTTLITDLIVIEDLILWYDCDYAAFYTTDVASFISGKTTLKETKIQILKNKQYEKYIKTNTNMLFYVNGPYYTNRMQWTYYFYKDGRLCLYQSKGCLICETNDKEQCKFNISRIGRFKGLYANAEVCKIDEFYLKRPNTHIPFSKLIGETNITEHFKLSKVQYLSDQHILIVYSGGFESRNFIVKLT